MNKIPYMERCEVYRKAIAKYGADKQMTVAIEEMSEVIKELCKLQRGIGNRDHLAEEIADATIVLEQMRMLFNLNQAVCDKMDEKIERLQRKVAWGMASKKKMREFCPYCGCYILDEAPNADGWVMCPCCEREVECDAAD